MYRESACANQQVAQWNEQWIQKLSERFADQRSTEAAYMAWISSEFAYV
jgi:hypothetical protein